MIYTEPNEVIFNGNRFLTFEYCDWLEINLEDEKKIVCCELISFDFERRSQ